MPSKKISRMVGERLKGRSLGKHKKEHHPLDLSYTGDTEKDDAQELSAIQAYLKKGKEQIAAGQDMGYYVPLVFLTREQMKEFLRQTGWDQYLDWTGAAIDGLALAKALKIKLTPVSLKFREKQADSRLIEEIGVLSD